MDLTLALIKLKSKYGIDKMVLSGGATINGEFHKCGLLDELSIVMAPYIEGNHNEKGYLELSSYVGNKYEIKEMKKLGDGGIHLVFERK